MTTRGKLPTLTRRRIPALIDFDQPSPDTNGGTEILDQFKQPTTARNEPPKANGSFIAAPG